MKTKTTTKKAPRPKLSVSECLTKLQDLSPALIPHTCVDREWLWICCKVPKAEFGEGTPKQLYAMGFRATKKKGGHPIEGTERVGYWGNACQKPTPFFRGGHGKSDTKSSVKDEETYTVNDPEIDALYAEAMSM